MDWDYGSPGEKGRESVDTQREAEQTFHLNERRTRKVLEGPGKERGHRPGWRIWLRVVVCVKGIPPDETAEVEPGRR